MLREKSKMKEKKYLKVFMGMALVIALIVFTAADTRLNKDAYRDLLSRKLKSRDSFLLTSVESTLANFSKGKIFLVDVRRPEEFSLFHIPGSMNIPLHFIRSKSFLKSRPLVLIGAEQNYSPMEAECLRLKKLGFSVTIMDGGLYQWKINNGPIIGDLFAQRSLNELTAKDFYLEKNYDHWLIIDVSAVRSDQSQWLFPYAAHLPLDDWFLSGLKQLVEKNAETPVLSVLILNQAGDNYDQIKQLLNSFPFKKIYYVQNGVNGYQTFIENMIAYTNPNRKTKKIDGGCKTCGTKENQDQQGENHE
jgi:rhodanese-related sulfurtransferase